MSCEGVRSDRSGRLVPFIKFKSQMTVVGSCTLTLERHQPTNIQALTVSYYNLLTSCLYCDCCLRDMQAFRLRPSAGVPIRYPERDALGSGRCIYGMGHEAQQ